MLAELKKVFKSMDKMLLTTVLLLALIGFVMIYSATISYGNPLKFTIVQFAAFAIGFAIMLFLVKIDYENFGNKTKIIYAINVVVLVLVLFLGTGDEVGTRGWIRIGGIGIQPSELVKIGFVLTFAKHLEQNEDGVNKFLPFLGMLAHAGVIILIVLLQPDYGTAMVYAFMFICMVFAAGIKYRTILIALGAFAAFAPVAWFFILKDYQKDRFITFFNPEHDPIGRGYQVIQSKISIGSGEFAGNGLFSGPQTQLGILPAKHTDFILGVIGEEFGFIGCIVVLVLLFALIIKCFKTGIEARSGYGKYLCIGIGAMLLFQTFENIGMCIGVMPVTGIPLPFLSYGGSSMLTSMIAVGLVMSVSARKKMIKF
ncbi:MAG: rod shape-determining protein RodA [Clostridia bacterium]|nr:rod shape-determining protein RodA [Clostridia bacterium]MBR2974053.1 rod shape-determining protein RodA [Clostridia bacterium]